jgi:protein TonB
MFLLRLVAMLTAAGLLAPAPAQEPKDKVRVLCTEWLQPIHKVEPEYPAAALARRIQGTVVFRATISKNGAVEDLNLVSGHPLLILAARQACEQYKFKPSWIGNEPVRAITKIAVQFEMDWHQRPPAA